MMHRPLAALLVAGFPALLGALKTKPVVDLLEESANPVQALDLLEENFLKKKENKKWNWKEASEESKTEWAIVLKRYVLADMTVYELSRKFGEALPSSSGPATADQKDSLEMAEKKLARFKSSLERAVLDQNTSDATAGDMQKARKTNLLTTHEKRILAQEHKREQYGFFAVQASAQDVLEKATELLQALEDFAHAQPAKAQPSWSSIVEAPPTPKPTYLSMLNMSSPNATQAVNSRGHKNTTHNTTSAKPTITSLYDKFEEVSKILHTDLGNFESMQSKAITTLLAMP